ncbi:uncharacterized protein K489DRAFT_390464 [Dissoconium aciculare CBS 342.82]|uniref:DUF1308 domain-containing protein n=1 Tax=Dissoconium aciculare CBS 342.82 TaxID=1314786 RepID=A0A6J3LWW9_9PEZI|nr:uncharacterized protein K489DRAFT_390464 [Dissoconium aciculare CBS 342.82]KAF1819799.1 hypothetical protein K489DRAFT_390464 [Dissoconium aciculare CBS 342.82]
MTQNETQDAVGDGVSVETVLGDLTARAEIILSELEAFRRYLRQIKQEQHIELAQFRNSVTSELSMLGRLASKIDEESTSHNARSSNLPFMETVWLHAKRSRNLVALRKRLYYNSNGKTLSEAMAHVGLNPQKPKKRGLKDSSVTVDAITEAGLKWVKVSLVTHTRLMFDLAKQGWTGTSDDEYSDYGSDDEDGDTDIPLLKTTKELCQAATCLRVRTRKPQVHLLLPRVTMGQSAEVDAIVESCRKAGAIVCCGKDTSHIPELQDAFVNMVPPLKPIVSDIANIDCTILLALVSDFSHAKVSKEPWFHPALKREVEIEGDENLLPSLLYPALGNRKLVCTHEAAVRMREIVDTLGTPTEVARTRILMGDDNADDQPGLVKSMQELSAYDVPSEWRIPVVIVDQNENDCQSKLPAEAVLAGSKMTPINKSVFLYGWALGCTTITSNRAAVKQIENSLQQHIDLDDSVFPSLWLCPTARSLVGKERRGAKKEDGRETARRLPDPLRREQQRRHGLDLLSQRAGHEVEDLRPQGYDCADVIEAKKASTKNLNIEKVET